MLAPLSPTLSAHCALTKSANCESSFHPRIFLLNALDQAVEQRRHFLHLCFVTEVECAWALTSAVAPNAVLPVGQTTSALDPDQELIHSPQFIQIAVSFVLAGKHFGVRV